MLVLALKRVLWAVPVLLVCVTLLTTAVVVATLLSDVALAAVDPRIRDAT